MKKKLLLVYPKSFAIAYTDMRYISYLTNKTGGMLNASLATIAALTPPEFDIKIIDENVEPIDFDEPYDLVGITGFPTQLFRAKKISEEFSKRGVLVVSGGPSVSVSPERWRPLSDVLIIGEAERIWPQFIADYLAGCHKSEYREVERFELTITPIPDYSGFSKASIRQFLGGIVQTSRGCPFDCEFCDVVVYVGHKMRYKSVDRIMQEVEQIYKMGLNVVFLADDNFSAGRKNAKNILRSLRDWNKKLKHPITFATQLSIDIAKDEEFLELAAEAGLNRVFIGIETPNIDSLKETHKLHNVRSDLIEDVKKFHQHGIVVSSGCIVGFDHDDLLIFNQQFDFLTKAGIPNAQVYPLQAPDGTPLKERMIKERRYIDSDDGGIVNDEHLNNFNTFSIIPKQMTIDQLQQGTYWLLWKLYGLENFANRLEIFFKNFEDSDKKKKLQFPNDKLYSKEDLGILWRLIKYYFTKASTTEKSALRLMLKYAKRSSHPQRFNIVIGAFLGAKNTQEMLLKQNTHIPQISYPEALSDAL